MIKKLASFVLCLAPISVMAEVVNIDNPFGGNLNIASTQDGIVMGGGDSFVVSGSITAAGKLWVGTNRTVSSFSGDIYTGDSINSEYSVTSGGNISLAGGINVADGYVFSIGGTDAPVLLNVGAVDVAADSEIRVSNVTDITMLQFTANGTHDNTINGSSLTVSDANGFQVNDSASAYVDLISGAFNVANGAIENNGSGILKIQAAGAVNTEHLTNASNDGQLIIYAASLNVTGGDSGTTASVVNKGNFEATIGGATTLAHGFDLGTMDTTNTFKLTTGTLSLGDRFDTFYSNNLSLFALNVTNGDIDTNSNIIRNGATNAGAVMNLTASGNVIATEIQNNATMNIVANNVNVGGANGIVNNAGTMDVTAGGAINTPRVSVTGGIINVNGVFAGLDNLYAAGGLYQNGSPSADGSIKFNGANYTLSAASVNVGKIAQTGAGDTFILRTDDLIVGNNGMDVRDFTVTTLNDANGVDITVGGNVSGGANIIGLESMTIGGNYTFDDTSRLLVVANSGYNYWSTAAFESGLVITNSSSAAPLITVGNDLVLNVTNTGTNSGALTSGQFGIDLRQSVDETSAIWLMRVDGANGVSQYSDLIRNLGVHFCNADGSVCTDTVDPDLLPAFLVAYDTDNDGMDESIYVVFNNPSGIFLLQPVVETVPGHTDGEWESAGALDDLIGAQLTVNGFTYDSPLSVINVIFNDTPLSRVDEELYARMNDYTRHGDATVIQNFARLFQLREANQIADSLALNNHAVFRDMSDRFIDESIWNRHRRLNKLWVDADYTMTTEDLENVDADGSRFSVTLGYDWQSSETLILGWFGHLSHSTSNVEDDIDLGYGANRGIAGRVDSDVTNLELGAGAYFIKTLSNKLRLYGDAMFTVNLIDVERNQTWVDKIEGDATAFGINSEFGLIHDWLNQYLIGNVYALIGYDFGFDMTEKVGGVEYMNLDFDGHVVLTPGYSLTLQKRVYPSAWFEFRPYVTAGVEYDVLGTPDTMKYKFVLANKWTDYHIEIDPLWANAGLGVEFLSVNGWHFGLGYRYNYNSNIQAHKIHASAKYRF